MVWSDLSLGLSLGTGGFVLSGLGLVRFVFVGLSFEVTAAISFDFWLSGKENHQTLSAKFLYYNVFRGHTRY